MKKLTINLIVVLVFPLLFAVGAATAAPSSVDEPPPPGELGIPGRVEGTGTHFAIADSEYLNVTLDSTQPIKVLFESIPQMVVLHLEPATGATSAQLTLSGFAPNTTYHRYEDGYQSHVPFTTDAAGSYSYTQDLSAPHLVFIQPRPSTLFIRDNSTGGDCTSIGTWDFSTKTCTLTTDVSQAIEIANDNVTLDGNGHSVTGSGSGTGVNLPLRTGVTVRNLTVSNFSHGIYLWGSSDSTISGNTVNSSGYGIYLAWGAGNTISGNTTSSGLSHSVGIYLHQSGGNTIANNTGASNTSKHVSITKACPIHRVWRSGGARSGVPDLWIHA